MEPLERCAQELGHWVSRMCWKMVGWLFGLAGEASDPEADGDETGDEALIGPFEGELLKSVQTVRVLVL